MIKLKTPLMGLVVSLLGLLAWTAPSGAETYAPTNWVNDPFNSDRKSVV